MDNVEIKNVCPKFEGPSEAWNTMIVAICALFRGVAKNTGNVEFQDGCAPQDRQDFQNFSMPNSDPRIPTGSLYGDVSEESVISVRNSRCPFVNINSGRNRGAIKPDRPKFDGKRRPK